ncbi:MAG: DUF6458 family protein [Actinomycetes bacterium]
MGVGGGIFLLVVGGILAFGVRDTWQAVDLTVIGYICMAAGALAVVLALAVNGQRRKTTHTEYIERRDSDQPPPRP